MCKSTKLVLLVCYRGACRSHTQDSIRLTFPYRFLEERTGCLCVLRSSIIVILNEFSYGTSVVSTVPGGLAIDIAGGRAHTCAVLSTGAVMCWGSNGNGQLGIGSTVDVHTPAAVDLAAGHAGVMRGDLYVFSCSFKMDVDGEKEVAVLP